MNLLSSEKRPRQDQEPLPGKYANKLGRNLILAKRIDTLARWGISCAGVGVIAAVLGILLLILNVVIPLFEPGEQSVASRHAIFPSDHGRVLNIGIGDFKETFFAITHDGLLSIYDQHSGAVLEQRSLQALGHRSPGEALVSALGHGRHRYTLQWAGGDSQLINVVFRPHFDEAGQRSIRPDVNVLATASDESEAPLSQTQMRVDESGSVIRVGIDAAGQLQYQREVVTSGGLFGGGGKKRIQQTIPGRAKVWVVSTSGHQVAVVDHQGRFVEIHSWQDLSSQTYQTTRLDYDLGQGALTALGYSFGDSSLILGDDQGRLTGWHFVSAAGSFAGDKSWRRFKDLPSHNSPIVAIEHSVRDQSIMARDRLGLLSMSYLTSARRLFTLKDRYGIDLFQLAPRNNGVVALNGAGEMVVWNLVQEHPETSFKTLFGPVWYENYHQPDFVWQSTGGSDEFESKMSLVPLIFGTLKATLYSLLFALPLSLLGAVYLSQFASQRVRAVAKPAIELMASLPSVVIGFLAALWLAPLVADKMVVLLLFVVIMPVVMMMFILLWPHLQTIPRLRRWESGREFLLILPVFGLSYLLAQSLAYPLNEMVFSQGMAQWLYDHFEIRYDLRNSIIISVALGFAVIPIILSISEDSLSNVPGSLVASSLALGASRWQTVWRLVVPSASPGIFAGVLIGIGRAVGETMIVLMATGNTPIIDLSPFNGMRTLSANIAVEVAEAPVDGTLYRTLFLCAVILFFMTFVLNTVGELVRHRLRKRYGRF